jgi:catechol 2,3-dioxygenase-like lactoylglutathione lyase family enzyme
MYNVEHFAIATQDVESLYNWYHEVLGFTVKRKIEKTPKRSQPVYYLTSGKGAIIEIHQIMGKESKRRRAKAPNYERRIEEVVEQGYSHICLVVKNFIKVVSDLKAKGVPVFGVKTTSLGWTEGFIVDPDGNIVELMQH